MFIINLDFLTIETQIKHKIKHKSILERKLSCDIKNVTLPIEVAYEVS